MKTLKEYLKTYRFVHIFLPILFLTFLFVACEKEDITQEDTEGLTAVSHKWHKKKILICHTGRNGHCRLLKISRRAWKWHKRHGDVRLDDRDGDGFVPDNACGYGQMGDCDDKDPMVNPNIPGSCRGVTDSDGDGVPDSEDECPEEAGPNFLNGCPDADGDGIADKDDDCPYEAGPPANNGCQNMELSDYEVLRIVYEANPGNTLGWDLGNTSMEDWNGVALDSNGNVKGFSVGTDGVSRGVTTLPAEIGMLKNLEGLIILRELESIPPEIGQLLNLRTLGVVASEATVIPNEIGNLDQLEILVISGNLQITGVPSILGNLTNLKRLDVSGNGLISVPQEIANLNQLEFLDLSLNPMTEIPQAICNLADTDTEVKLDSDDACQ